MPSDTLDDGRQGQRIQNYTKFWQKDLNKEADSDTNNRVESYADVVNGYYDGATDLYEYGWAGSFHFSRFFKGEAFAASLARHEHYLAAQMSLRPGMRVLDVGCGVGGPARQIAQFADVNIVGLNNNAFQLQRARKYAKRAGLEGQIQFVQGDFMKLSEQFGENSFDAIYAIEATVHAPTWEGVYGEIFKILKPGGVFGVYEWCMTDARNAPSAPGPPSHQKRRFRDRARRGSGRASRRSYVVLPAGGQHLEGADVVGLLHGVENQLERQDCDAQWASPVGVARFHAERHNGSWRDAEDCW
jgi:sterol 24-C-methyltransferase